MCGPMHCLVGKRSAAEKDFVHHRTDDGRAFRTLNILDEFSRECLAIRVKRKLNSIDVIDVLTDMFILRGVPGYIRSDNGPEFVAKAVRKWIGAVGARTAYIEPGSPSRRCKATPAGQRLGGRLYRKLQRPSQGRTAQRRNLLLIEGSSNHHRAMAPALQYQTTSQCPWIQASST